MTLLMLMVVLSTTALIPHFLHGAESNTPACLWVHGAAGPVTHDGLHEHTVSQAYCYGRCLELEDGRDHELIENQTVTLCSKV